MRSKLLVALVSCFITAAVVGGFAIAAIPNGNTINACRNKTTFVLRVIDKDLGQTCTSSETALSWSSWRWSGPFLGSSTYRVGDVVRYSGSSYLAKGPLAPPAGTLPTNTSYWALVVAKGDPGPVGPVGPVGGLSCADEVRIKAAVPLFAWTPACSTSSTLSNVAKISGNQGAHVCTLLTDGTARCWGLNVYGELGDGSRTDSRMAVRVDGLPNIVAMGAGNSHSCAVLADRTVRCWGYNGGGELGNNGEASAVVPLPVVGLSGVTTITTGFHHSCALMVDTSVKCWGFNGQGQLGRGSSSVASYIPETVVGLTGATAVSAGGRHSCALLADATVKCWGGNDFGALGDGTTTSSTVPVAVTGLGNVTAISAGQDHSCALLADATVKCWGANQFGELGNGTGTDSGVAVNVTGLAGVTTINVGQATSCAVLESGTAKCWGSNGYGQLGDGTLSNANTPVAVSGVSDIISIVAGGEGKSCALLADTTVRCWGRNNFGQLGNGTLADSVAPVTVVSLP